MCGKGFERLIELLRCSTPGLGEKVTAAAFNRRMLCYPMGGNDVNGVEGGGYSDHVLIAPAYIVTESVRLQPRLLLIQNLSCPTLNGCGFECFRR